MAALRPLRPEAAPGENRGGEKHQPRHEPREEESGVTSSSIAPKAPPIRLATTSMRNESPAAPGAFAPRPAHRDLGREQRDGRGDVGGARIHARQHQRRQGDEGAAAGQRILGAGPDRSEEEDDESQGRTGMEMTAQANGSSPPIEVISPFRNVARPATKFAENPYTLCRKFGHLSRPKMLGWARPWEGSGTWRHTCWP